MAKKVYIVELDARNGAALKKIQEIEGATIKASDRMGKAFNRVGAALIAAFSAQQVLSFMRSSIDAFKESEVAIKKLDTALGKGSKSLQNYAKDLQKITSFSDDATIEAMSLIAAFTKEENKIKGLIKVTQDFATAKGVDLSSAADLVTKTFASSTNALARYGIKVEGAAGSTERYNSILKALTIYQGQAEAQGKTLTGQMERLNNELNDQQEIIGQGLLPFWIQISKIFAGGLNLVKDAGEFIRKRSEIREPLSKPGDFVLFSTPLSELKTKAIETVKESIPWLKQQQDRLKEIKELIDAGNLSESVYMALKKEEASIEKSLTLEKEKQVKLEATRIIQFKTAADLWNSIQGSKFGESERDKRLREGPFGFMEGGKPGTGLGDRLWGRNQKSKEEMFGESFKRNFEEAESPMSALVSLSNQMASNFSFAGHTFVGQLSQAIAMVDSISNMILTVASMFGGGGGFGIGGLLSMLFGGGGAGAALEKGGRITNLGGNISHTKIPSFAMGGSYSTPGMSGPFGGGYPVMVHKNETLDVYNAGQTSRLEKIMNDVRNAILTTNLHVSKGGKNQLQPIIVNVDGQTLFKVNTRRNNRASRAGVNTGEFI